MKRDGNILGRIASPSNLRLAFWKASKGLRDRPGVIEFGRRLDQFVGEARNELLEGAYSPGPYRAFEIRDPKPRWIHAPAFRDRVIHHAILNVCESTFEKGHISDTFACRKGRGRLKAIRRAERFCRRQDWFLKLDVRKYFDSIDHGILTRILETRFKDRGVLAIFRRILASYQTEPGKGLPIGSLTSQHFANLYLAPLDRFVKEELRIRGYVRYMDDMLILGDTSAALASIRQAVRGFALEALGLEFKPSVWINRTSLGVDFLGYRVGRGSTRLTSDGCYRLRRAVKGVLSGLDKEEISSLAAQNRLTAMVAFVDGTGNPSERSRVFRGIRAWSE